MIVIVYKVIVSNELVNTEALLLRRNTEFTEIRINLEQGKLDE